MIVKKHKSGNEFIFAGGMWIRNFTKEVIQPVSLSSMFQSDEFDAIVQNEELNKNYPKISEENIFFDKMVIVSDGHNFENIHTIISKFPKNVAVLTVNKALKKWKLIGNHVRDEDRRTINAYVVNNPHEEARFYLPEKDHQYFPVCISSTKTNAAFLKKYKGDIYTYVGNQETKFGMVRNEVYYIDDYRNPICACIGLAHRFKVKSLMLMCCDDSFDDQRDFAVKLENGLWTYPQHIKSHEIIDANLHWLTHQQEKEIKVANYSSGPDYVNAAYISSEEEAIRFFSDNEEGTNNEQ